MGDCTSRKCSRWVQARSFSRQPATTTAILPRRRGRARRLPRPLRGPHRHRLPRHESGRRAAATPRPSPAAAPAATPAAIPADDAADAAADADADAAAVAAAVEGDAGGRGTTAAAGPRRSSASAAAGPRRSSAVVAAADADADAVYAVAAAWPPDLLCGLPQELIAAEVPP